MDKILVTRPRIGSRHRKNLATKRARGSRDYESLPSSSAMRPKDLRSERKDLNEYLKPLIRYLASSCNRPWNKVYSDICKNMDKRGTMQNHIFQHLFDYVKLNAEIVNGAPHGGGRLGRYPLWDNGWTFYVDADGILKKPPRKPEVIEEKNPNIHKVEDSLYLCREDGTWFEVILSAFDAFAWPRKRTPEWIVALLGEWKLRHKTVALRSLSKKEKKNLGLNGRRA